MTESSGNEQAQDLKLELSKRRREILIVFLVSFLFVFLTWFEIRLFTTSQQLPFQHSIFFFGLVNFNIILLLLLLFLIFRNVVKVFVERKGKVLGSSLKAKLIAAFLSFSIVPTLLMFIISVFYINSSFDKWFSVKMVSLLKSSIEVQDAYYFSAKKRNYHFAHQATQEVLQTTQQDQIKKILKRSQKEYALDAIEFYPSLFDKRILVTSTEEHISEIPPVSLEFLKKGISAQVEASIIHQFGEGNLVRVIVPVKEGVERGAIVISSFVPLSLISRMNDVRSAYEEFRDINPLEYPLKSIYLIILVLMTFVILLAATWFGFYLAKQLSIPLVQLGRATKRVAEGNYESLDIRSGSEEISSLISNFNMMTQNLSMSEKELKDYTKYIEVVLRDISAGVISVDKENKITTINNRAAQILKIEVDKYLHHPVRELMSLDDFRIFAELLKAMIENKTESVQKEFNVTVDNEVLPLSISLSLLKDADGNEIGKVLVFDDLTLIVNAQRAAAWTEVARRIAHEIKNPLTPIKLSAERLQRKFGEQLVDPAFKDCTQMIIRQVDDLKNLVNEFSQFARLPQTHPVVSSLNQVISESMQLFEQAHPQIKFVSDLDSQLPQFKFDPDQIRRVFVNLVDNSVSAVSDKKNASVQVKTEFKKDLQSVKVSVIDNGLGIPAANLKRIFEPYFSTKETGTGLGLAIVRRIIEDHNGFIRASQNQPHGTIMTIELPLGKFDSAENRVK